MLKTSGRLIFFNIEGHSNNDPKMHFLVPNEGTACKNLFEKDLSGSNASISLKGTHLVYIYTVGKIFRKFSPCLCLSFSKLVHSVRL